MMVIIRRVGLENRELIANSFAVYFEAYVSGLIAGKYIYSKEYNGIVNADDL